MKSTPITSTFFTRNRAKLAELMTQGSVAIVGSNEQVLRNGDQYYPYRQHSDFFYLAGIAQEDSVLLLAPGHADPHLHEILCIRKPTPKSFLWAGPGLTRAEAAMQSGVSEVRWLEDLDELIGMLVPGASTIYTSGNVPVDRISGQHPDKVKALLGPLMTNLRMVKEVEEVEEIRKASAITGEAFLRVLKMMKPGVWEYEVEAEVIAEFIAGGARGHAYEPIMACGKNAMILHYVANSNICHEGELLLMDFGAEVNNYAADCSRTIPVSGRFTKRQRKVYEAVLRVFRKAKDMMVPGILMAEFHERVGQLWEEEHIRLGLYSLKEARAQHPEEPLWKKYFMHGTSHSLGLDVHDPFERSAPFEPGMVLTCEPAIYLPEEEMGIRLENNILIRKGGAVDLMEGIPMEVDEIEGLMQLKP